MEGQVQEVTQKKDNNDDVMMDECLTGDAHAILHGIRAGYVKRKPVLNASDDGVMDDTGDVNAAAVVSGLGKIVRIFEESKYGAQPATRNSGV